MKVCLGIVLRLQTISLVFEDPELICKSDSDIELVEVTDAHLLRRLHAQTGIQEKLATLSGGGTPPNVVFKTMVSRSSASEQRTAVNGILLL